MASCGAMTLVDVVLGSLVLGLAGWALAQTGSAKPAGGGCGGRCAPRACGSGEPAADDDPLVTLGGRDSARER
jgi:hypothetical protein